MNPLRHLHRPSAPTVISLVALFFAMSGTAVAATGGNFILGSSNAATSVSSLTNTKGTALHLSSTATAPPLTVSNSVLIPGLNASKLGGIGPAGFVQGGGHEVTAEIELTVGQSNAALLNLPGYGQFKVTCLNVPIAEVDFTVGPDAVHLWTQDITGTSPGVSEQDMVPGSGLGLQTGVSAEQVQWTIQDARSASLSHHLATVQTDEAVKGNNTSKCDFAAVGYAAP